MKALIRGSLASLIGSVALFVAPAAFAEGEPCINDVDCPGNGAACGGDVCNWNKSSGDASKPYACNPAGSETPKGNDGWCTNNSDCKCMGQGATCRAPHCTFTKASEAPAGGGSASGGSASGGTSSSGSAGAPATAAGTTSTGGTGTTPTAGTGSTTTPAPAADSGGCSVSAPGRSNTGLVLAFGVVAGLGVALSRRRR
jgi:hypothetical protein